MEENKTEKMVKIAVETYERFKETGEWPCPKLYRPLILDIYTRYIHNKIKHDKSKNKIC